MDHNHVFPGRRGRGGGGGGEGRRRGGEGEGRGGEGEGRGRGGEGKKGRESKQVRESEDKWEELKTKLQFF